jgi:hypothetical protein
MRHRTRRVHNELETNPEKQTCRRLGCGHIRSKHKGTCMALHYDPFGPTRSCECTEFIEPPPPPADAKPLPPMITMRLRWTGEAPRIGEWMMGQGATARFAYRIISVHEAKSDVLTYQIEALKIPRAERPADAITHPLTWDTRHPSKGNANKGAAIKQGAGWGNE